MAAGCRCWRRPRWWRMSCQSRRRRTWCLPYQSRWRRWFLSFERWQPSSFPHDGSLFSGVGTVWCRAASAADWRRLHVGRTSEDTEGQVPVRQAIVACLGQTAIYLASYDGAYGLWANAYWTYRPWVIGYKHHVAIFIRVFSWFPKHPVFAYLSASSF